MKTEVVFFSLCLLYALININKLFFIIIIKKILKSKYDFSKIPNTNNHHYRSLLFHVM